MIDRGEVEKRTVTLDLVEHGRIRWRLEKMHRDWDLDLHRDPNVASRRVPRSQPILVVPDRIVCVLRSFCFGWLSASDLLVDLSSSNGNYGVWFGI